MLEFFLGLFFGTAAGIVIASLLRAAAGNDRAQQVCSRTEDAEALTEVNGDPEQEVCGHPRSPGVLTIVRNDRAQQACARTRNTAALKQSDRRSTPPKWSVVK